MEPFLGQIQAFGFNFAPRGWAQCNGQLLPISQNTALFSLLGTMYGGDGRTTFALPDLQGRSIVGIGNGPGLDSITQGEKGGTYQTVLSTQNLPAHTHNVSVSVNSAGGEEASATGYIASHAAAFNESPTSGAKLAGVIEASVGANAPFSNRSPFLGINVCIAMQGIFPPRS